MNLLIVIGVFLFVLGCCIGSFLNVVIYRMPLDKSLVYPGSSCPSCGKNIPFYDNIPIVSWILLGGKCRACKTAISPQYIFVELITGLLFLGLFLFYFLSPYRSHGLKGPDFLSHFLSGGWLLYGLHIILLTCLLAASAIDLKHWVIPLSICWVGTLAGIIVTSVSPYIINIYTISTYKLFPVGSSKICALSAGALVGWIISITLLLTGLIKRSYEFEGQEDSEDFDEDNIKHRCEVLKEIVFLFPIVLGIILGNVIYSKHPGFNDWWIKFSQIPIVSGFLGSLWGYFVGCGTVWITRILGTLAFGKEAMGLGDVHLMGAVGAVIGPVMVVIAFFIAPFFGLIWALFQMFFKKTRQIPYGPFLSLGVFAVMILNDWFQLRIAELFLIE